jgi:hypothetical protein
MTLRTLSVTIPAGKVVSDALDCSGAVRIVRLIMPAGWTTAPLTFCMSPDNTVYHDLYHVTPGSLASYEVTVPIVTPDAVLAFPPTTGTVVAWFKIRSGTHAAPVVQAAARTFQVVVEEPDAANVVEGPTGPAGSAGSVGAAGPAGPTGAKGATGAYNPVGTIAADEAASGMVGEVISSSNFGGVSLTTAVAMNITQISLTPGDWNVGGVVIFTPTGTGPNSVIAALSQVAASLPSDNDVATGKAIMQQIWASSMPAGKTQTTPTSLIRINTSTPKQVYLVGQATFGGGTVTCTGYISARRIR